MDGLDDRNYPSPRELIEALAAMRIAMVDIQNAKASIIALESDVMQVKVTGLQAKEERGKILDEVRDMRVDLHTEGSWRDKVEGGWTVILRIGMIISFLFFAAVEVYKIVRL